PAGALVDTDQAESRRLLDRLLVAEAAAVVPDPDVHPVFVGEEADLDPARARMADGIEQRLLHEQSDLVRAETAHRQRSTGGDQADRHLRGRLDFTDHPLDQRLQPLLAAPVTADVPQGPSQLGVSLADDLS